jgi:O-antigen/teichoic acid export membrane protein
MPAPWPGSPGGRVATRARPPEALVPSRFVISRSSTSLAGAAGETRESLVDDPRAAPASPEPGAIPDPSEREQAVAVTRGARWVAGSQVAQQVTKAGSSIVLARLLRPTDFGLLAITVVLTDFLERVLGDTGTSAALIHRKELDQDLASSVFFLNLMVGVVTCAFLFLAAPVLAPALGDDRVEPILRGVGVAFVLLALGLVQRALLRRALRFRAVAAGDLASTATQTVVAVALALRGWGVWSLVVGILVGRMASNVTVWWVSAWRPRWHFRWADIRQVTGFSGNLSAFNFFSYFSEAGDKFIVGRFVSAAALGFYGFGYRLLLQPVQSVLQVCRVVLFPAFARIQEDNDSIGRGYVRATSAVAMLTFPVTIGIAVMAEPIVRVVLGEKWLPAVPILAIFGPLAAIQAVSTTTSVLYQAKGRTDLQFRWGMVVGLAMLGSYLIGSRWGATGVAWSFLLGTLVLAVPTLAIPFNLVDLPFRRFLVGLLPSAVPTAIMAAAAYGLRRALEAGGAGPGVTLFIPVGVGAAIYCGIVLVTRPQALRDLVLLVRPRRPAAAAA